MATTKLTPIQKYIATKVQVINNQYYLGGMRVSVK